MTRVLIVDDSALLRQVMTEMLSSATDLEVVGTAKDGLQALERIETLRPDVITLDVEMPRLDGMAFLERLMRDSPLPVVMVSSQTGSGTESTLRALELGAIDFVLKPTLGIRDGVVKLTQEIIDKVRIAAVARIGRRRRRSRPTSTETVTVGRRRTRTAPQRRSSPGSNASRRPTASSNPIVIGASTGGTEAIRQILSTLPARAPGIVIVQHMPAGFTASFAKRLDSLCTISVKEAEDGDPVEPGLALIAPGGRHVEIERAGPRLRVRVLDAPPVNRHAPSVDVLFRSCARTLACNATGVLLTGMGDDGARGLAEMHRAGAHTIAQDEDSCVVYGMPRAAVELGAVDLLLPIDEITDSLMGTPR